MFRSGSRFRIHAVFTAFGFLDVVGQMFRGSRGERKAELAKAKEAENKARKMAAVQQRTSDEITSNPTAAACRTAVSLISKVCM